MLALLSPMRNPRVVGTSAPTPAEDDDKVTSEELFGDLVDAPLPEPRTAPANPKAGPIKVRVTEPGAEVGQAAAAALPEEVAALLDAFSPSEPARDQAANPTPEPEPDPAPVPP